MVNTLVININNEDLKTIRAGIDKLYELISGFIGETYNPDYEWLYQLYSFIYEKLKFGDVK